VNIEVHFSETIETFGGVGGGVSSMAVRHAIETVEVKTHMPQRRVDSETNSAARLSRNGDTIGYNRGRQRSRFAALGNQHCIVAAWLEVKGESTWLTRNLIPVNINIRGLRRRVNTGIAIVRNRTSNVDVDENFGEFTVTLGSVGSNIFLGNAISRASGVIVVDGNITGIPQNSRESKVNGLAVLIIYFDHIGRRQRSTGSNLAHKVRSSLACAWFTRQLKGVNNNVVRHRGVNTSSITVLRHAALLMQVDGHLGELVVTLGSVGGSLCSLATRGAVSVREVNSDIVVIFQLFDIEDNRVALLGSDRDSIRSGLRSVSSNRGNEHRGVATFFWWEYRNSDVIGHPTLRGYTNFFTARSGSTGNLKLIISNTSILFPTLTVAKVVSGCTLEASILDKEINKGRSSFTSGGESNVLVLLHGLFLIAKVVIGSLLVNRLDPTKRSIEPHLGDLEVDSVRVGSIVVDHFNDAFRQSRIGGSLGNHDSRVSTQAVLVLIEGWVARSRTSPTPPAFPSHRAHKERRDEELQVRHGQSMFLF
jgi:hypothetical protein